MKRKEGEANRIPSQRADGRCKSARLRGVPLRSGKWWIWRVRPIQRPKMAERQAGWQRGNILSSLWGTGVFCFFS